LGHPVGQQARVRHISIQGLIPQTDDYITYDGSLTQPGCQETVTWVVINKPLYISVDNVTDSHLFLPLLQLYVVDRLLQLIATKVVLHSCTHYFTFVSLFFRHILFCLLLHLIFISHIQLHNRLFSYKMSEHTG